MGGFFEELSGAKGIRDAGESAKRISEFKAEVSRQNAKAELLRSAFNQQQQAKEAERIKSAVKAEIGSAGGAGSPVAVDIELEQARELELENLLVGFEGEIAAARLRSQAQLDILQGQLAKQQAKSAARAANVGFGLQLATLAFLAKSSFGGGGGGTQTNTISGFRDLPSGSALT